MKSFNLSPKTSPKVGLSSSSEPLSKYDFVMALSLSTTFSASNVALIDNEIRSFSTSTPSTLTPTTSPGSNTSLGEPM